ncbi:MULTISPECIES: CATRA system-associated protein [Streptomyces]|uniref:CATRA system-associated protein n=1 Tax=Streptomyces TaxID=1883 RepID=UPI00240CF2BD|nr:MULTISPECIES: CATRA system-associated protein [Streptomyces]WFB83605.1 hypothetical protein MMU79_09905 [Streptomyces olivaceus]WGK45908.1 hypothetical protein M6G09_09930 [Streptomyces sp. B146]
MSSLDSGKRVVRVLDRALTWEGTREDWKLVDDRLEQLSSAVSEGEPRSVLRAVVVLERALGQRAPVPITDGRPRPQGIPEPTRETVHRIWHLTGEPEPDTSAGASDGHQ